ncbi:MAG: hypothetical protein RL141_207 [Candidatus Parcubacteria bacterium]|jgi:hypothetical protein
MSRRAVELPEQDRLFLEGLGRQWEVVQDGSIWVLMHDFPLPEGYTEPSVTLAIRIESGYPVAQLDMMYLYPKVQRKDGKQIAASDALQQLDQKEFQRWSRHRGPDNQWKPGEDSLETHVYLMEEALRNELTK